MARVDFEQVEKVYPGGTQALYDCSLERRGRRAAGAGGPVGLRQVDAAAPARGSRSADPRRDPHRRSRRQRRVAAVAQRRDGVPGLRALPAHDGAREPGIPAAHEASSRRDDVARRVAKTAELLELDAAARPPAAPALRRPAPARRDGARAGARTRRLPARRAALEPRRQAARPGARRDRNAAAPHRHDDALRHARPGRGDDARRSRRGAARGPAPAGRDAARALRAAGERLRRGLHRLAADEPVRGARRDRRERATGTRRRRHAARNPRARCSKPPRSTTARR